MTNGAHLLGGHVNVNALEVVRKNHTFTRADRGCPFCATCLSSRVVIGRALLTIDEKRQPRGVGHRAGKQGKTENEQAEAKPFHENLPPRWRIMCEATISGRTLGRRYPIDRSKIAHRGDSLRAGQPSLASDPSRLDCSESFRG